MSKTLIWMIDKDRINTEPGDVSRTNYGQRMTDAQYTHISHQDINPTINMSDNCSSREIPVGDKIRWKAYDDDGELYYEGHISAKALLEDDDSGIDYGYFVDQFVMADAGAVHVYWNIDDISKHNPEYASAHPSSNKPGWIEIYC
jgi:hypothetical protein